MSDTANHDDIPEVTLGWRLRMAMERAGLKADAMAEQLGVHRGTITRWTHDIGSPPRPIYMERWAALCQVPYSWLVGDLYTRGREDRVGASSTRVTSRSNRGCVSSTRRYSLKGNRAVDCLPAVA